MSPHTPIAEWPECLTPAELAVLLRVALKTVQNKCSKGRMWPPPVAYASGQYVKPYRFKKATVLAFVNGQLPKPRSTR